MTQETALSWLQDKLNNVKPTQFCSIETIKEWVEQAKAIEKERVVNFCFECLRGDNIHTIKSNKELLEYIEQYYNETYNK